nr:terminase gpA endonuclease subunit [uncultured Cohaesibacter sp.]
MRPIPNYHRSKGRLPPYVQPHEIIAATIDSARPPMRMSIPDAAVEFRRVDSASYRGPWRHEDAPYLVEPMQVMGSRRFTAMVFIGPARTIKTEGLILNGVAHGIMCNPRPMKIIHITEKDADTFSEKKLDVMIEASPELKAKLGTGYRDSTLKNKRFTNGASVSMGWPAIGQLSGTDWPFICGCDYDRWPMDIGGEGTPFGMMRKRTQTYGSQGMAMLECSPGFPILDETWEPKTPHEAPPCIGGLAEYQGGTRARYYWRCTHSECEQDFEPDFMDLVWPEGATPGEARHEAYMRCPCCGGRLEPKQKYELNLDGRWYHETGGASICLLDEPDLIDTDTASYWLKGPCATFQPWGELVFRYLSALEELKRTGDEGPLKTTVTVDQGNAYLPGGLKEEDELTAQKLKDLSEDYPLKIAPAGTRFVTLQIDVQKNSFVCQADAWGVDLERWLIDRFEIVVPPEGAPDADERSIKPPLYLEDWEALLPLFDRVYPVEGADYGLVPLVLDCDSGGEPGVTDNAYKFWRKLRDAKAPNRTGLHKRFQLVKGASHDRARRAEVAYPESASKGRKVASDIPLMFISRGELKDAVAASLLRKEPGPNKYHLSKHLPDAVFAELSAERKTAKKGWEKKSGTQPNEALDLACYGRASTIVLGVEKMDWSNPQVWAIDGPANINAVQIVSDEPEPDAVKEPSKPERQAGNRTGFRLQRQRDFLRR